MRALRKLVLGETWSLPLGVAILVIAALALHELAGGRAWWRHDGGFLLLALAVGALTASLLPALRRD